MIIEHEGNCYNVVIKKPIIEGEYYYDFMINKVIVLLDQAICAYVGVFDVVVVIRWQ